MEDLLITDARGYRTRCNPSNRIAIKNAVWSLTQDIGLADDIADWSECASLGYSNTYKVHRLKVEIVPALAY